VKVASAKMYSGKLQFKGVQGHSACNGIARTARAGAQAQGTMPLQGRLPDD